MVFKPNMIKEKNNGSFNEKIKKFQFYVKFDNSFKFI